MAEAPSSSLAARTLERLQKLADGNGVAPGTIKLLGAEEKVWVLEGTTKLEPILETKIAHYLGTPRGKAQTLPDPTTLRAEIERRQSALRDGTGWISDALAQLKSQPGEGWGLDNVKISLPQQSAVLAASVTCPTCQGQKMLPCPECRGQGSVTCAHCRGARQEICYNCNGLGTNPGHPEQICGICNGRRYIPCRYCQAMGQLVCPTCQGKRGLTCTACNGAGAMTEEVTLNCAIRTHFTLARGEFPSGLRRGLDRAGLANLPNGFADVETWTPEPPKEELPPAPLMMAGPSPAAEPPEEKKLEPEIHYRAHLPYADLRISFGSRAVLISCFGKRGALLGVPAFLDDALAPTREILGKAARGAGDVAAVMNMRLMRDALALQLANKTDARELRRLYPQGLSPAAAQEIMSNMRLAINRGTLRTRTIIAVLCALIAGALFGGIFFTPIHTRMTGGLAPYGALSVDLGIVCIVLGVAWAMLSSATGFVLRREFPNAHIPLAQKIGKTGLTMLGVIVLLFATAVWFAPVRPGWVGQIFH